MKKVINLILSLIMIFSLIACSSDELPDGFIKEDVLSQSQAAISSLNDQDYAGVVKLFSDEMKVALDAQSLETALGSLITNLGAFKSFDSQAVSVKNGIAISVIVCKYENGNATYTISIDKNNKVCGLYMK